MVDDLSACDLAPTFMEIGGIKPPVGLYGRSLVGVLKSDRSGRERSIRR